MCATQCHWQLDEQLHVNECKHTVVVNSHAGVPATCVSYHRLHPVAGKVVSAAAGPVADAAQQLQWEGDAGLELLGRQAGHQTACVVACVSAAEWQHPAPVLLS